MAEAQTERIQFTGTGTGISRICESRDSSSTSLLFHTFKVPLDTSAIFAQISA